MSDTGLPPSSGTPLPPLPPQAARGEYAVRIESIEASLRNITQPVHLEGRVIAHNEDGTVRIRTEKGDIDIRLPPARAAALKDGQSVEIDIPPGNPPRQAILRPETSVPAAQNLPDARRPLPQAAPSTTFPDTTDTATKPPERLLREISLQEHISAPSAHPSSKPALLKERDIVRIAPLTQEQTLQIIQLTADPAKTITAQISRPALQPQSYLPSLVLPQKTSAKTLLQILKTPVLAKPPILPGSENARAAPNSPLFSATNLSTPQDENIPIPPSLRQDPPSISENQIIQTKLPQPALTQHYLPFNQTQPTSGNVLTIAFIASPSQPAFDARIVNIAPPTAQLVAPSEATEKPQTSPLFFSPPDNLHLTAQAHDFFTPVIKNNTEAASQKTVFISDNSPVTLKAHFIGILPDNNKTPVFSMPHLEGENPVLFSLPATESSALVPGTTITLTPLPASPATFTSAPTNTEFHALPTPPWTLFSGFDWPVFDDLFRIIPQSLTAAAAPSAQTSLHATAIPAPAHPAQLPATALLFIAAVRAGDVTGWLGEKTIDALRRAGREDMIGRISRDFAGLSKTDSDPVSQDWRALALPLQWDNEIQKMMIYYRHGHNKDQDDNKEGSKKDTRFILEFSPPRMGTVQLDGLCRGKKLDLILRTQKHLSPSMQQNLRRLWLEALEQTGMSGELSFQGKPEKFIKIDMATPVTSQNVSA